MIPRLSLDISWTDFASGLGFCFASSHPNYKILEELWPQGQYAAAFLSVRSAWDAYLATRDWPKGSEIMMSAVTIPHMIDITRAHGYVPVPIDLDLTDMSPRIDQIETQSSERTKALIVAHLFGGTLDLEPLVEICKRQNWELIEDCAQAYQGGLPKSSLGVTLSLFSFGTIKSSSALGGSLILTTDPELHTSLTRYRRQFPLHLQRRYALKIIKYSLLKFMTIPKVFGCLWWMCNRLSVDFDDLLNGSVRGFSKVNLIAGIRQQPPQALLRLIVRRLSQDRQDYFQVRGNNAHALWSMLPNEVLPLGAQAKHQSAWLLPVVTPDKKSLVTYLRKRGFDATCRASSMCALPSPKGFSEPVEARRACESILYLPVYNPLGTDGYHRLGQVITQFYQEKREDG